jgi:homocysteine S-methyltransferase
MESAQDPSAEGIAGAREMLAIARARFSGACLMPPFDRYELVAQILRT